MSMKLKEQDHLQQLVKQNLLIKKRESESKNSSGSHTPRKKLKVIKEFSQFKYGVPTDSQIIQIDGSSQSCLRETRVQVFNQTTCKSCGLRSQEVKVKKCGKAGKMWCILLAPLCLCFLPLWVDSCRDTEQRCVQCWQTKSRKQAKLCFCS